MPDLPPGVWMAQAHGGTPIVVRTEIGDAKSAAEGAFRIELAERAPYDFEIERFEARGGRRLRGPVGLWRGRGTLDGIQREPVGAAGLEHLTGAAGPPLRDRSDQGRSDPARIRQIERDGTVLSRPI